MTGNELVSEARGTGRYRASWSPRGGRLRPLRRRPAHRSPARARMPARARSRSAIPPSVLPQPGAGAAHRPALGRWAWAAGRARAGCSRRSTSTSRGGSPRPSSRPPPTTRCALALDAQLAAGVDVVTDGEQRRDNYASFVGARLDNCQLIPHHRPPALRRRPGRVRARAAGARRAGRQGAPPGRLRPAVARPRPSPSTSWTSCAARTDRAGEGGAARPLPADPDHVDGVRLRPRLRRPRGAGRRRGAGAARGDRTSCWPPAPPWCSSTSRSCPRWSSAARVGGNRTFMCGALGARRDTPEELAFAERPARTGSTPACRAERLALHVCRGNWTPRRVGGARRRLPAARAAPARGRRSARCFLELARRAPGEIEVLADLPARQADRRRAWSTRSVPGDRALPRSCCQRPSGRCGSSAPSACS